MDSAHDSFVAKNIRIATVVASYWVVSISLVFLNKYLLSSPDLKFDAPIFVTWFQCIVSVLLCALLDLLARAFPQLISFPRFQIKPKTAREVLPLSIVMVAMVLFNNLCLKYVGVAFYYISRSLSTVFNVALSYAILNMITSKKACVCCAIIIAGYLLGVDQEDVSGSLSISGTVYGVLASLFVALNAIYTSRILPAVDNNVWRLTLYNNVNAVVLFLPLVIFSGDFSALYNFESITSTKFWVAMLVSGVFGFAIAYVTGLQIQVTSPLTHNVSGTAKACCQTVLGCIYYAELKTGLWWLSNGVVLLGSLAYTHIKRQEMKLEFVRQLKASSAPTFSERLVVVNESSQSSGHGLEGVLDSRESGSIGNK